MNLIIFQEQNKTYQDNKTTNKLQMRNNSNYEETLIEQSRISELDNSKSAV